MAENLDFTILRGCDYVIRMRLIQPPSVGDTGTIASWTMVFEVRQTRGATPVLSITGSLSSVPRAAELGIFDFRMTAAQSAALTDKTYHYAVRRTDTGFVDVFSKGLLGSESF